MHHTVGPRYFQHHSEDFCYTFKKRPEGSVTLKIHDASQKVIKRVSISSESIGTEYFQNILSQKDLPLVLEHLVKINLIARDVYPSTHQPEQTNQGLELSFQALETAVFQEDNRQIASVIEKIKATDPSLRGLDSEQRRFVLLQCQLQRQQQSIEQEQIHLMDILSIASGKNAGSLLNEILLSAVVKEQERVVRALMRFPGHISINQANGHQPFLVQAVGSGNINIVRSLLEHPDINISCPQTVGHRHTPLALAERAQRHDIFDLLIGHNRLLKQKFDEFKAQRLGVIHYLHLHYFDEFIVVAGTDANGKRKLIDLIDTPRDLPLQQLANRGLTGVECLCIVFAGHPRVKNISETPIFPEAKVYCMERAGVKNIHERLEDSFAIACKEFSGTINDLLKYPLGPRGTQSLLPIAYRAIYEKGKSFFAPD